MINKRLLIKNLLNHNDENSFYDKKLRLSLDTKEGKSKFLKHICALSNSNPQNNSYMLIGVDDKSNSFVGTDFFDDSKIQNLVNAYLLNPPKIQYENIRFPKLPRYKVIGLVTIFPNNKIASLNKNAWKYKKGTVFYRRGSNSIPVYENFELKNTNKHIVASIEKNASNNLELMLNGVVDFIKNHKIEYHPRYKVFHEQFVLCWAGKKSIIQENEFYSRVDIELINDHVQLFYSALDDVQITYNTNTFIVTEYILLEIDKKEKHYPLEKAIINFKENGVYHITHELIFEPPKFDNDFMQHLYTNNNHIVAKIEMNQALSVIEHEDVFRLPHNYLICYLNGFLDAAEQLKKAKNYIKSIDNETLYIKYKEALRVMRKIKYK